MFPATNLKAKKYSIAFSALNEVVAVWYGQELYPDFEENIEKFTEAYLSLNINVTPKIDAVMHHITEFCHLIDRDLGSWSQQSGEAIYHHYKQTWKRFKINDTQNKNYGKHFLQAVSTHNSQHL